MALPIFTTSNKDMTLLQTNWATELNPLLKNPVNNGLLLKDIVIASGSNVINHRLGRKMQGWVVVDINSSAQIYRSAAFNDLTLTLTSSAAATISLYVF